MSALLDDGYVPAWPEHISRPISRRPALRLVASNLVVEPCRPLSRTAPVRLTRRGVAVLVVGVALLAVALVWFAWLSAPSGAGSPAAPVVRGNSVAVAPGDSLWSIAERVAPNRDPRAEVDLLQRLNHLDGSATLVPGQVLRIH